MVDGAQSGTETSRLLLAIVLSGPSLMVLAGIVALMRRIDAIVAGINALVDHAITTAVHAPAAFLFYIGLSITVLVALVVFTIVTSAADGGRYA